MMFKLILLSLLTASTKALDCFLPLDVLFLQDTTGSQEGIIGTLIEQIPLVYAGIASRFPETYFGVAEFKDKPYYPLGVEDGFCYKLDQPMTDDMAAVVEAYGWLYASGGGDIPESQYQAIIDAALDPAVQWRPIYDPSTLTSTEGYIGGRIIIMMTDAVPHLNGDMAKFTAYPTVPQGLPENSGIISTDDVSFECLYQEYPSPDQVRAALQSANASLIIVTPDDPAIVPAWTWVNSDLLGQPAEFYHVGKGAYGQLYQELVTLLERFSYQVPCPSTTTPLPTTTQEETATIPSGSTAKSSTTPLSPLTTLPQCQACPCVSPGPCAMCPSECDAAVVVRIAKEPKKLQVIVDNQ